MRVKTHTQVDSKDVVFEPGNATRYHLVLTKINRDTLVISDIYSRKAIILDPEFPSVESYQYTLQNKYDYSESDATAIAEGIVKALAETYYIKYRTVDIFDEVEIHYYWCKDPHSLDEAYEHIATENGTILDKGFLWQ